MKAIYYSLTDKGITRDHNEDAFLNNSQYSLFMVADGMGGHEWGDVASRVLLSSIVAYLELSLPEAAIISENSLRSAVNYGNRTIYNLKLTDESLKTVGTTLVGFIPGFFCGFAFNVGDSRLYRLREGKLEQMTKDHSLENTLPDFMQGLGQGKYSSVLSKALGAAKDEGIDLYEFDLKKDDLILLCTDGLYTMVPEEEIIKILSLTGSLKFKGEQLVAEANKRGGEDNITVTLIQCFDMDQREQFEMIPA